MCSQNASQSNKFLVTINSFLVLVFFLFSFYLLITIYKNQIQIFIATKQNLIKIIYSFIAE